MTVNSFFFYGSLVDLELLEAVIDRKAAGLAFTQGWLAGYAAETALGYTFPTLIESQKTALAPRLDRAPPRP